MGYRFRWENSRDIKASHSLKMFTYLEDIKVGLKGGRTREIEKRKYIDRKEHSILCKRIMVLLPSEGGIFLLSTSTVSVNLHLICSCFSM